jgi:hypothetical protein
MSETSEEKEVVAPTEKEREDAFSEGLNETLRELRGDEPEVEQAEEESPAADLEPKEKEPEKPEDPPPEEAVLVGLTETQIKTALAKANQFDELQGKLDTETSKLHGKIGELNRTVQALSKAKKTGNITVKLDKFKEAYPDLAEDLEADLQNSFGSAETVDPVEVDDRIQTAIDAALVAANAETEKKINEVARSYELNILKSKHPKWLETANSDDFKVFEGTLGAGDKEILATSRKGLELASVFDKFESWQDKTKNKNKSRLEKAITPKGGQEPPKKPSINYFEQSKRETLNRLRGGIN